MKGSHVEIVAPKLAELKAAGTWSRKALGALGTLLNKGPNLALYRMNPLSFAASKGLDEDECVDLRAPAPRGSAPDRPSPLPLPAEHAAPLALASPERFGDFTTYDAATAQVVEQLRAAAPSALSVLLLGESGTGKELLAARIHQESGRTGAFVPVSCAAIPENLMESELFGHVGGAYTGARGDRPGAFVAARGGTLFLTRSATRRCRCRSACSAPSRPNVRARPENRTIQIGGQSAFGFRAFTSMASQTSWGSVSSSGGRPEPTAGTRSRPAPAASAGVWCSVIFPPAGAQRPRPTRSSFPARDSRGGSVRPSRLDSTNRVSGIPGAVQRGCRLG